jgi:hypothetical protein
MESAVATTARSTTFAHVAQRRGNRFKSGSVRVRILPWALSGRLTGQAMPGLFAKEIVPQCAVWGASPQPSATFHLPRDVIGTFRSYKPAFSVQIRAGRPCSCSLKKTASLINSIALDEGRMSERYRPGVPILKNTKKNRPEEIIM